MLVSHYLQVVSVLVLALAVPVQIVLGIIWVCCHCEVNSCCSKVKRIALVIDCITTAIVAMHRQFRHFVV
jgi:hypothetical protein